MIKQRKKNKQTIKEKTMKQKYKQITRCKIKHKQSNYKQTDKNMSITTIKHKIHFHPKITLCFIIYLNF